MSFHVLINPVITSRAANFAEFFEGCLSVPGFIALVPRALDVTVEYLDEKGDRQPVKAHGWYARVLQHEIDHLNGSLYCDRMRSRSFMTLDWWAKRWKGRPIAEVLSAEEFLQEM